MALSIMNCWASSTESVIFRCSSEVAWVPHESIAGKFIDYNSSERYITMKMGKKYHMTIRNMDQQYLDTTSKLSVLPKELFTKHIFQYLSAYELFSLRRVCKEWNEYVRDAWHSIFKRYAQCHSDKCCRSSSLLNSARK